jgi:hypothetical protein
MKKLVWRAGQAAICTCRGDRYMCVVASSTKGLYPKLRDEQGEEHTCTQPVFVDRRRRKEEREKIEIDLTHAHAALAHVAEREEWLKMLDSSSAQIADKYGRLLMAYTQLELLCKNAIARIGMASTRDSMYKALRSIER